MVTQIDRTVVIFGKFSFPEPPKSYIESFMTLVLSYLKLQPPDDLTRELAYRMLKQKIAFLKVAELNNTIYVIGFKEGSFVVFVIHPPKEEDDSKKFRGWKYRTVRDPKQIPLEVLRVAVKVLERAVSN